LLEEKQVLMLVVEGTLINSLENLMELKRQHLEEKIFIVQKKHLKEKQDARQRKIQTDPLLKLAHTEVL